MTPRIATVDFETEGIDARPAYPPRPVGCAIYLPGRKPRYLAWGHPLENNTTERDAHRELAAIWRDYALLFWHAKFDLDVAETHLRLKPPPVDRVHDALFLAFLDDPHATDLHLKPYAARVLDLPPNERDAVRDWIFKHVPEARGKPRAWRDWGRYICRAPGALVGAYAIGDVERTRRVFDRLHADVVDRRGMDAAYRRELELLPVVLAMERGGVPVDLRRLERDVATWTRWLDATDAWLRRTLAAPQLDVDSNVDLADALERASKVTEWILTPPSTAFPNGQRSTSKENLLEVVNDAAVLHALQYRSKLANSLRTFGRPWLEMARASDGRIFTTWNQIRGHTESGGATGARTGRFSSQPNFQNIPKTPQAIALLRAATTDALTLPAALHRVVGPLPNLRDYIAAPRGASLLNRDYSQQELRILGHYENGVLLQAYRDDPRMDLHERARQLINARLNKQYARKPIKNMGFGLIYGMGLGKLAATTGADVAEARRLRDAYLAIFPGLGALTADLKRRAQTNAPIHTWGGREYHVEPPRFVDGRLRTFDYKLLNVLIQGSAADCTKQAMINYHALARDGRLLLTVHDELLAICPTGARRAEMERLREAMESVPFDVPMLSDGKWGATSWARLKEVR